MIMRPHRFYVIALHQWNNCMKHVSQTTTRSAILPNTKNSSSVLTQRCLHLSLQNYDKNDNPSQRSKPIIFSMQNPFTWLLTKIDFFMLRRTWDPTFSEKEFCTGVRQAICAITELISENKLDQLEGLLTKKAIEETQHDIETNWTDEQRRNISLKEADIQATVPRRVYFKRDNNIKLCDVDVVLLAVKPDPYKIRSIIFIEVNARFQREYSEFCKAEWTISLFKIPRFKVYSTVKN